MDLTTSNSEASSHESIADLPALVEEACNRIYVLARQTPVARLPRHPRVPATTRAFAKMEQLQVTGSFKLRGASNKIFALAAEVSARDRSLRQERDFTTALTDSLPGLFVLIDERRRCARWKKRSAANRF